MVVLSVPSWKAWEYGAQNKSGIALFVAFVYLFFVLSYIYRKIDESNKTIFDQVVDYRGHRKTISWRSDFEQTHLHKYRVWCTVRDVKENIYGNRKPIRENDRVTFFDVWWSFQGKYVHDQKEKNRIAYIIRRDNRLNGKSIEIELIQFTGDQQRI